jgi:putative transcriptional regulator
LGQRTELSTLRIEKKMTQEEVSKKALISRAFYANIEAGRKDPSIKVAKRIADALSTTVDKIFFNQNVPKRNTA